jgi:hypothetical protein
MQRLFEGKPQRTDGRLTKENLRREAQVSRATMNRATGVLDDWDAHLTERGSLTPGEARRDEEIVQLRARLAGKTRECTEFRKQLQAAATAIAALHHDNTLLRQDLEQSGEIISLDERRRIWHQAQPSASSLRLRCFLRRTMFSEPSPFDSHVRLHDGIFDHPAWAVPVSPAMASAVGDIWTPTATATVSPLVLWHWG